MTSQSRDLSHAERCMRDLLYATWRIADTQNDDETVHLCQVALDALGLPWASTSEEAN